MLGRFKEVVKKYGKVAMGVHFSVSAASISGIYVAIKNNVDVESVLEKIGLPNLIKKRNENENENSADFGKGLSNDVVLGEKLKTGDLSTEVEGKQRNRNSELVVSSGGALGLAILLNKALFPVRVPITMVLTPAVARFLARRNLYKNSV